MKTRIVEKELRRRVAKDGQAEVARQLGVSRAYICRLMAQNETRREISTNIAEKLGFSLSYKRR